MAPVLNKRLQGSRAKPNIIGSSAKTKTWSTCQTDYYMALVQNQILHGSRTSQILHGSRAKPNITFLKSQTEYYMAHMPN
jgi:hypothetical protein